MPSTKAILEGLATLDAIKKETVETNGKKETVYSCSVWEAFDEMQLCYTLSPQLKNYYRYGTFKDCSHLKSRFYTCLNVKRMSEADSQSVLQELYHKESLEKQKHGKYRPSNAIWKIRDRPLENFPPKVTLTNLKEIEDSI